MNLGRIKKFTNCTCAINNFSKILHIHREQHRKTERKVQATLGGCPNSSRKIDIKKANSKISKFWVKCSCEFF